MLVDAAHYRDGLRLSDESLDIAGAASIAADPHLEGFVWLGLAAPTDEELIELRHRFDLNELAIEDAQSMHLRPKVELYNDPSILFCVLRAARYDDAREEVQFGEVSLFVADRFVITVRQGEIAGLGTARERLERRPDLLRHGPSSVLWAVLDKIVDDYAPVVAGLDQDVDEIEESVFVGSAPAVERIYRLRGQANEFDRAVHPLLGPSESLLRGIYPLVAEALVPFFRDVNDHLKLIVEEIQSQRDRLVTILQANTAIIALRQSEIGNRQNDTVKVLTIISTVFLPLTFITGFFGMNFGWLVRRIDPFWVFAVFGIGTLLVSSAILWAWFTWSGLIGPGESPDAPFADPSVTGDAD